MSLQIELKKSSASGKLPSASDLALGEIGLNFNADGPFLSCKDSAGNVRRLNSVRVGTTAFTSSTVGELWLDTSVNPALLKVYQDSSATWVPAVTIPIATASAFGIVRLASTADVTNGTAGRIIDAAQLASAVANYVRTITGVAPLSVTGSPANRVIAIAPGSARQLLQTNSAGTGVEFASNIEVPGTLDVTGAATFDSNVTVEGDLTVNGTETIINTQTLDVEDKNIVIGKVNTPTDVTADGGGITLKGATDKTINWVDATDAWTFSEHVDLANAKEYRIANIKVLDATSLGSAVISSSLTSVGTIGTGTWQGTAIADTYLETIASAGKVSNSATTATNANTANAIVARDASGNFSAGTITANLTGTASAIADNTVTSAKIVDGAIVNADINASAAIGLAKLATGALPTGITVESANIVDGTIVNADISASAGIVDTKLATIATAGKVSNSATTAASTNTNNAIVARDASGNFSAGTITADLAGNASTVTTNADLTGDVTSVGNATSIAAGVIVDADINASAAIAPSKLGSGNLPSGISGSSLTSVGTLTAGTLGAGFTTVAPAQGGTGQTTYANGELLIGKTDGTLAKATLTASTGVTIANADGSITISATGSGGTVTGVTATSPLASTGGTTPDISIQDGTTAQKGAVQLEDSTSSTSITKAATPNAVKSAYDLAAAALPKSGGTMTGDITFSGTQTFPGAGSGTVTSIDVAGGTGLTSSGGPITSSGTITVDLDNTAVTPSSYTYASITVDQQGRLTAASSGTTPLTSSDIGSTVQSYDADTAKLDVAQTFTAVQTLTDPAIIGTILEDVFTISDGAAFEVDPGNGSIQLITLGANRTPKATNFAAGESITLMVDDGSAYTLTWTDATWGTGGVIWIGGSAPTLATSGYTVVQFWKVGTQVYGALVGEVA